MPDKLAYFSGTCRPHITRASQTLDRRSRLGSTTKNLKMIDRIQKKTRGSHLSAADLRMLVDQAPDIIFVANKDDCYTFVNQTGCRLLGYARKEIVGKNIFDLVPAEDVDQLRDFRAQMRRGVCQVAEWRLRRKDGTWLPIEVSARGVRGGRWQGLMRDISKRKAREAERGAFGQQAETEGKWLRTVLDTLPLGVLLFRHDGRVAYNRRTEEIFGMTFSSEGGGAQYASRIHFPDGRRVPTEALPSTRALRDGITVNAEKYRVERADGSFIPVLISVAPIRDNDGRVSGAMGVFQDMSERMRTEQAVSDKQRLLQGILDILPVGVWVADATGRIVSNNAASERIWKGARYVRVPEFGEYKGWWVDTGKPIAAEEWAMARAVTKGETSIGEIVRIQCFDGSFKTIINSAAPLRDANGNIEGAIVVNEDISALHEAQEKQRASEQLLRTVIDLLPVGLWIADREGHITLANPAGDRIWKGTRYIGLEQFPEYKGWWIETGKPIAPAEWGLARAVRRGETSRGELIRIQCFDGSFKTVINWAAPIRSDAGEVIGAVAINEDVTSLQQTQEQLRAAVRDREEILAIVAHDLRNPLSGLMIGASAVEKNARRLPGGEAVRELAATLVDISRRTSGLVEDLLAVAVSTTGGGSMLRLAPVDAAKLVARADEAARPLLASKGLELESNVEDRLPQVNADADRILRVFANLLDNALKFTSPPGRVMLAADRTAGGVRFSVVNSGPALTDEQRRAMFRPFWQAGRDARGAGMGLSICRAIVEAHGGTIWAEPAKGQRVRVCCVLPRR
jgi:PAS domain S-box-containing protein